MKEVLKALMYYGSTGVLILMYYGCTTSNLHKCALVCEVRPERDMT